MVAFSEALANMFWEAFPYSLLVFALPIVYLWYRSRKKGYEIVNRVELFRKGGTKEFISCTVRDDTIEFKIGEVENQIPIIAHPRIETSSDKTYRTYLVAEGTSETIDIPPLTEKEKEKIISEMKRLKLYAEDLDTTDKSDEDLIKDIQFYNFDIAQLLDKPTPKAFNVAINAYQHTMGNLIENLRHMEEGTSKLYTISIFIVGLVIGVLLGYMGVTKGVI